jgi:hypothetical protein
MIRTDIQHLGGTALTERLAAKVPLPGNPCGDGTPAGEPRSGPRRSGGSGARLPYCGMPVSEPPPRRVAAASSLPVALGALFLLGILLSLGSRPPSPRPATAPPDEFSGERAMRVLGHLLAEGVPHPVGTPANFVVRDRIIEHLEELGYAVEVQRTFSCRTGGIQCAPVENVMTRLPGRGEGRAVMLTSHYDSRGAGPGAGDAGSAVAAILEIARILRAEAPFPNPIVILLSDGEEAGLLGAEVFVREHPWAADVAAVVNLEARGTTGPSIMFETSDANRWLVAAYGRAASRPVASSLTYDVYRLLPNDTDATVYRRAGMAVLNFAFIGELAHYHSALDDLTHLNPRSVQHHGDNGLAAVRALASMPLEPRGGDAAYTDVFGLILLHWPASWMLPLAALFTIVVFGAAVLLVRRRELTVVELGFGVLAAVAALVVAVAVGWAAGALLVAVTGRHGVAHAYPAAAYIALWAGAATAVLGVATLVARWASFLGLLFGGWLLLSLLTVLVAAWLPGAAVVLFVPQGIAVVALGLAVFSPRGVRPAPDSAAMIAALGAGFTLIQLTLLLQATFVLDLPLAIAAVVALAALPLMPFTAVPASGARTRNSVIAAGTFIALSAFIAALMVPGYSELRPQSLNFVYVEDAEREEQWWVAQGVTDSGQLPASVRAAADFSASAPAWAPRTVRGPAAPAPYAGLPGPQVQVTPHPGAGAHRTVAMRIRAAQPGNRVLLTIPGVSALRMEGHLVAGLGGAGGAPTMWIIQGVPAEGVLVEVDLIGDAPRHAVVHDITPGLPPAGAALLQTRPRTAMPFADGDASVAILRLWL